jgi:hypothetical protein
LFFEFPSDEFRGIVDTKDSYLLSAESFCLGAEFGKESRRFTARFHEVYKDVSRIATNKKDEILTCSVRGRERAANVGMDAFKEACSAMRGLSRKGGPRDISFCTDGAGVVTGVVEINAFGSRAEAFYAYMPH